MNIYDKLQEIIEVKKYRLSASLFSDEHKQALDTETDKDIFDLLKNISSLAMKVSDNGVEFCPYLIMDGKRTFAIEDLSEDYYTLLSSLDLSKIPLNLKARISDILWTQKKDFKCAVLAAEAYFDLYDLWFSDNDWLEPLDMIKRAICISAQINKKDLYEKCCQSIYNHITRIDGTDKDFLSISLIEILLVQSSGDLNKIVDILNKIISLNANNPNKTEHAYSLKSQCFYKLKNPDLAKQSNIDMADYFANYAEYILKNDAQGALRAQLFFNKAIFAYRNNGEPQKAESTHKRLVEVQKGILDLMQPITFEYDGKKIIDNITQNMENLSFEQSIIRLTQMISFYKKDEYQKKVLDEIKEHPISHLFTSAVINGDGQTVLSLPGLEISDPEKDQALLDLHIHRKMLEFQRISGNMYLKPAFSYVSSHYNVDNENLDFLIKDNFIIPVGRENVIRSAIIMVLKGHYYEALHIMAPQAENIFRNIAKEVGGLTVTLETDGTSKEKVLSSIFDLPELKDCYDNDILFLFKGLLNEQAGANIRNEIAHGIMSEYNANSGACLYFICAFLKLLVMSSGNCIEIYKQNPKLQTFIKPESVLVNNSEE